MKYPPLQPGILIERKNRFSALVQLDGGKTTTAYVPTTGRAGALQPGCRYGWNKRTILTQDRLHPPAERTAGGGLCSVKATMANTLFAEAVSTGLLAAFLLQTLKRGHLWAQPLTFACHHLERCAAEVKSVTFVENGVGMFPDAPTTRGRRHLETLAELAAGGEQASAVFIAQRGDAQRFAPYETVDPEFAARLRQVNLAGVEVHAYRCDVRLDRIEIAEEISVVL